MVAFSLENQVDPAALLANLEGNQRLIIDRIRGEMQR